MREDLQFARQPNHHGWTIEFSQADRAWGRTQLNGPYFPADPLEFRKGTEVVWKVRDGWMKARLDNGRMMEHTLFPTLSKALGIAKEVNMLQVVWNGNPVGELLPGRTSDRHCLNGHPVMYVLMDPPRQGDWKYYCPDCKTLTVAAEEFDPNAPLPEGAIGTVTAINVQVANA